MRMSLLPLLMLASGCTMAVYNPEKGRQEAQADIESCKQEANRRHYWDRMAALNVANQCLEAKGYRRGPAAGPVASDGRRKPDPGQPCEIPC
ncbi:hypothetical protein [Sphingosinicella rhizophila]|uniref:Lipoprotein n=1 Tax=Sphingosinicella rhizophila TaxID=3050082 RepID=A0ABU3Q6R1_9SPHN|nr:hypothetical protein [Sphingosinicella sp. GR2756]MDT9599085.1 hypothetical protein [Sphingosinicella sp. GR2756]